MISIKKLEKNKLDDFIQYLTDHLSENGQNGTPLFQPLSKQQSVLSDDWKVKFKDGIDKENGEIGWRKVWVAINEENRIT